MASLKELRDRISSVKATQKITKAMQMVAAAKFRLAQEAAEAARPYTEALEEMFRLAMAQGDKTAIPAFFSEKANPEKYLLLIFTAERGLCGGFNSQIARFAKARILSLQAAGKEVKLFFVGKKGADLLRREFSSLFIKEVSLRDVKKLSHAEAQMISTKLEDLFLEHGFDVCDLIYSRFVSVLEQNPISQQIIPAFSSNMASSAEGEDELDNAAPINTAEIDYEFVPEAEILLPDLIEQRMRQQLFSALLENAAGEMGAKMTAMDNATRNAGEMVDTLSVSFNRRRQAQITTELIEIIAGAEAL